MSLGQEGHDLVVWQGPVKANLFGKPEPAGERLQRRPKRAVADDAVVPAEVRPCRRERGQGMQRDGDALLLDQTADRDQLQRTAAERALLVMNDVAGDPHALHQRPVFRCTRLDQRAPEYLVHCQVFGTERRPASALLVNAAA